jgi:hypothetical protein
MGTYDGTISGGVTLNQPGAGTSKAMTFDGTTFIHDGFWHHIVVILSGGMVTGYLDGQADIPRAFAVPPFVNSQLSISGEQPGNYWPGSLQDVAIYPRALSPAEIAAHYELRVPA